MSVFFPAGTFYEDFDMNFDVKEKPIYLHDETIPVHSNFTITIEDNKYTDSQRKKCSLQDISKSGREAIIVLLERIMYYT
jgi:hypothetical protein